ncbi:MAG: M28 family peptidase [Hydrogeniiclostridium mannosilyticum]
MEFSTGVYDNGAGSVINMEILRWFRSIRPPYSEVHGYGSEEQGLEGSWAYVRAHAEELKTPADDQCGYWRPGFGRG